TVRKSRSLRRFFITAPVDPCESDEIALDIALCINERSVRCNVEIRAAASSHCDFRKHGLWTSNGREVAQIEPDSLEPSLRSVDPCLRKVDEMSALQIPRMSATFEQNLSLAGLEIENGDLSVIDGALGAFLAPVARRQNGKKECATTRQKLRPPEGGLSLTMV